ncbi:hypothetical protein BASA81_007573 [Batrachochytrium salamandrivorans]|nr:hypothetical protein BASA81_007573 [Batrachochytrium salamandrivorans]
MTDQRAQLDQLSEELALVQGAISPKDAGKSLRDYMDSASKSDALAGTADGPNPWLQVPAAGGGCCVIS